MQESWFLSLGQEDPLEKRTATHCSILAWRIPWTEEESFAFIKYLFNLFILLVVLGLHCFMLTYSRCGEGTEVLLGLSLRWFLLL